MAGFHRYGHAEVETQLNQHARVHVEAGIQHGDLAARNLQRMLSADDHPRLFGQFGLGTALLLRGALLEPPFEVLLEDHSLGGFALLVLPCRGRRDDNTEKW
ncbi:MAG: hypothetical protein ACQESR_18360 [Planctomycetota bacterium]